MVLLSNVFVKDFILALLSQVTLLPFATQTFLCSGKQVHLWPLLFLRIRQIWVYLWELPIAVIDRIYELVARPVILLFIDFLIYHLLRQHVWFIFFFFNFLIKGVYLLPLQLLITMLLNRRHRKLHIIVHRFAIVATLPCHQSGRFERGVTLFYFWDAIHLLNRNIFVWVKSWNDLIRLQYMVLSGLGLYRLLLILIKPLAKYLHIADCQVLPLCIFRNLLFIFRM